MDISQPQPIPRKGWLQQIRALLIFSLFPLGGMIVGWLGAMATDSLGWSFDIALSGADWAAAALLVLPILFLVILAHELGHLLGGRLVGFRFLLLIVGPLLIQHMGGSLRVQLNRNLGLAGGLAASAPDDDHNLPRRMLVMVAGGPLTSLILGALALLSLPLLSGLPALLMLLVGAISAAIGVATLIPLQSGGFASDGARILMLLRGGPQVERWCVHALLARLALTNRPRDLRQDLLARATAYGEGGFDAVSAALLGYSWAIDSGLPAEAAAHLDHALRHIADFPPALQPAIRLEAAYFNAWHRGDAAAARMWLDQSAGGMLIERHTRSRVRAAVLLAEGQIAEARAEAQKGQEALRRLNPGPIGQFEADLLEAILRRCS